MASVPTGNPVGRPDELTDINRQKIEEVAALDGTIEEMAYYVGVSKQSIYNWFKRDPEFFGRVEALRQRPVLAARTEIVKGIKGDKDFSLRYLERKRPSEFMPNAKVILGGSVETTTPEISKALEAVREEYEAKLQKALSEPEKIIQLDPSEVTVTTEPTHEVPPETE